MDLESRSCNGWAQIRAVGASVEEKVESVSEGLVKVTHEHQTQLVAAHRVLEGGFAQLGSDVVGSATSLNLSAGLGLISHELPEASDFVFEALSEVDSSRDNRKGQSRLAEDEQ